MGYSISKFMGLKSQQAAEAGLAVCRNQDESNLFLGELCNWIDGANKTLTSAIAKSKKSDLTAEGIELDGHFGTHLTNMRQIVRMQAPLVDLGIRSSASQKLWNGLQRHGGHIEDLPRGEQVIAAENFFSEFPPTSPLFADAGVEVFAQKAFDTHCELKTVEEQKKDIADNEDSIPNVSDASRNLNPLISMLYNHVEDYAKLENPLYKDLLVKLNNRLAPIASQVKGESTRRDNESLEDE